MVQHILTSPEHRHNKMFPCTCVVAVNVPTDRQTTHPHTPNHVSPDVKKNSASCRINPSPNDRATRDFAPGLEKGFKSAFYHAAVTKPLVLVRDLIVVKGLEKSLYDFTGTIFAACVNCDISVSRVREWNAPQYYHRVTQTRQKW